jgi:mRNA interferase RelE/StbE
MALAWMRPSSGAASLTCSTTLAPRNGRAGTLESRRPPRARRQFARLPEKIATAAAEFVTGLLLENPHRVGHSLQDEYAGQYSARRGPDWRVRYRIDEDTHMVVVLAISHRSDTCGT